MFSERAFFFFCGGMFFEIFPIIPNIWFCNSDIARPNGDITRPNGDITRPHGDIFYNGVFFLQNKLLFTRTTNSYAFWSNSGKKYHMEDVGIYIYYIYNIYIYIYILYILYLLYIYYIYYIYIYILHIIFISHENPLWCLVNSTMFVAEIMKNHHGFQFQGPHRCWHDLSRPARRCLAGSHQSWFSSVMRSWGRQQELLNIPWLIGCEMRLMPLGLLEIIVTCNHL